MTGGPPRAADAQSLERAIALAIRAHRGQRYPSPEGEPFILHPLRVMLAARGFRLQTVGVLHDILEDTETTAADLRAAGFDAEIVDAVIALTRDPATGYDEYIEQLAGNGMARQVKLADLAENLANNERLPPTPDVVARIDRYRRAIRRLSRDSDLP